MTFIRFPTRSSGQVAIQVLPLSVDYILLYYGSTCVISGQNQGMIGFTLTITSCNGEHSVVIVNQH